MLGRPAHEAADSITAREALRRETADVHEALHQNGLLKRLADGSISTEDYGRLMLRFFRFYSIADDALTFACKRFSNQLSGYSYVARSPIFASDLRDLGLSCAPSPAADAQFECIIGEVQCAAELTGALYVIEGSVLGGSQLYKSAASVVPTDAGCGYWLWCRQHGPRRWAQTRALIESAGTGTAERATMAVSAKAMFRRLGASLSPEPETNRLNV